MSSKEVGMNKNFFIMCALGIAFSTSACVNNNQNPLDNLLSSTKKTFSTLTSSSSSEINYDKPQGFTTSINGDDCFITIYKDRVHSLFYIGDAEPALLFKITNKTPTSFSAICVADVSFDKWNNKHPKGTISGEMLGDNLIITFSNPDVDITGNNLKSITLKKVNSDINGFIEEKKNIFNRKI